MNTWGKIVWGLSMLVGVDAAAQSTFNLTNQSATAFRIDAPPVIDGRLDESLWLTAPCATNFTQSRPYPRSAPTHRTEVWIAYDDQNLYVGAQMYDPAPDSILQQLSVRDQVENSDEFGIWFSPTTTASTPWASAPHLEVHQRLHHECPRL